MMTLGMGVESSSTQVQKRQRHEHRQLLYMDDLVVTAESKGKLIIKLKWLKDGMKSNGLKVNMNKTEVMISEESC